MGLIEWLVPQDKVFFDLFEQHAEICVEAANLLVKLTEDFTDVKNKCHKLEELEHRGDEITHSIYEHLNLTFITPMEPEEIGRLASALDNILDYIEGAAHMMMNFDIKSTDSAMIELAKIISLGTTELHLAVKAIRKIKDPSYIEERCIEVNRLENLADDVKTAAIRDLFKSKDPMEVIKLKDIYYGLEMATDMCEDAANVLSDIAIRHS